MFNYCLHYLLKEHSWNFNLTIFVVVLLVQLFTRQSGIDLDKIVIGLNLLNNNPNLSGLNNIDYFKKHYVNISINLIILR